MLREKSGILHGQKLPPMNLALQRPANEKHEKNPWMRRTILFGDSLLKIPCRLFDMPKELESSLVSSLNRQYDEDPQFGAKFVMEMKFYNEAGGRMSDIRALATEYFELWKLRGFRPPDIVVIYTISDLDDVHNVLKNNEPDAQQNAKRIVTSYKRELEAVLKFLLGAKVKRVILVGPGLHGSKGEIPSVWPSQSYITDMVAGNKKICSSFSNCVHMDIRAKYMSFIQEKVKQKVVPKDLNEFVGKHWPNTKVENSDYGGIVTFDGEHANYPGTKILFNMLVEKFISFNDIWSTPKDMAKFPVTKKLLPPSSAVNHNEQGDTG
jgi:hypothetical protein